MRAFRHEDRMEYKYVTAGKENFLLAHLCFWGGVAGVVAGFTVFPPALFFGGIAIAASICLLYTSPSPRDRTRSRMPSSA